MNLDEFLYYDTFRAGQRELALSVYEACKKGQYLVAEAMSGFGKTAAILSGSLLAAHEDGLRIFYSCRTKRQMSRVMEEVSLIQSKKRIAAIDISSKYDYCLLMSKAHVTIPPESFKWYCSFHVTNNLCSYFLNLTLKNDKATWLARANAGGSISHSLLMQKSQQLHICPYEVTRLALPSAKIITTTYHYVLDEGKPLLFSDPQFQPSQTILICDEAHNLRDFMRDVSTINLSFLDLARSKEETKRLFNTRLYEDINILQTRINTFCSKYKNWRINKESFLDAICENRNETWLAELSLELSACANIAWHSLSSQEILPCATLKLGAFLSTFLASLRREELLLIRSDSSLSILNVDNSKRFVDITRKFRSTILLSATLGPSQLYIDSMGLPSSTIVHKTEEIPSLRITTLIDLGVTTKFRLRSDDMYAKIASKIACAASITRGGTGVFVSSYVVLNSLLPFVEKILGKDGLLVESKGISNQEATEMMESFRTKKQSTLLAVQGGRFSEGEDFRGDSMNTSVVVGLSMPPPSPVLFAEYMYHNKSGKQGSYLVLSLLPALRKAFQSAGRHIRNPQKRGIVLFLDSRFNNKKIIELMPSWLKQNLIVRDFSEGEIRQITNYCLAKNDNDTHQNGIPFR